MNKLRDSVLSVRVMVCGSPGVGKSGILLIEINKAIVVRYLTKRFIGEYHSGADEKYVSLVLLDEESVQLHVIDTSSTEEKDLQWADAFILVYSVCDRASFYTALRQIKHIQDCRSPEYVPILLLGNKSDLEHYQAVTCREVENITIQHGCQFAHVSAAERHCYITEAINGLLREAKSYVQQRQLTRKHRRKNSQTLRTVSKALAFVFGMNSNSRTNSTDEPLTIPTTNESCSEQSKTCSNLG